MSEHEGKPSLAGTVTLGRGKRCHQRLGITVYLCGPASPEWTLPFQQPALSFFFERRDEEKVTHPVTRVKIVLARTTATCSAWVTTQTLHPGSPLPLRGKESGAISTS